MLVCVKRIDAASGSRWLKEDTSSIDQSDVMRSCGSHTFIGYLTSKERQTMTQRVIGELYRVLGYRKRDWNLANIASAYDTLPNIAAPGDDLSTV